MQQNRKPLLLLLLVLACVVLLVTGTFAAFTNVESIKRVVATRASSQDLPFSSNYLNESSGDYVRHIIAVPRAENSSTTIYLTLFNYPQNDSTRVSDETITYSLEYEVIGDGSNYSLSISPFPANPCTLPGNQISFHTYALRFTREDVSALEGRRLRFTATGSSASFSSKTLAAEFQLVFASEQSSDWGIRWADSDLAGDLDAFNYEVYCNAPGTITVDWSGADYVTLSQWSREDLLKWAPSESTSTTVSFHVGAQDQPTSYLLQFYRLKGRSHTDAAPVISVNFSPDPPDTSPSNP